VTSPRDGASDDFLRRDPGATLPRRDCGNDAMSTEPRGELGSIKLNVDVNGWVGGGILSAAEIDIQ
jgi:hypothetical protein